MSDALWRDQDMEAAVLGAMFLRGADSEVMEVIASLPDTAFNFPQYRDIYRAVTEQARGKSVIDPMLIGEQLPEHQVLIDQTGRIAWAKSSPQQLVRNAALRDAFHALSGALNSLTAASNRFVFWKRLKQLWEQFRQNLTLFARLLWMTCFLQS